MTLKGLTTQRCVEALLGPPTLGELRLFHRKCIRNGSDLLKKGRTCGRLQCERLLSSTEPLLAAVISPSSLRGFFFRMGAGRLGKCYKGQPRANKVMHGGSLSWDNTVRRSSTLLFSPHLFERRNWLSLLFG